MKNQMELTITISVGSSIQIATFVVPLLVIVGWISGHELTLFFANFEVRWFPRWRTMNWFFAIRRLYCSCQWCLWILSSSTCFLSLPPHSVPLLMTFHLTGMENRTIWKVSCSFRCTLSSRLLVRSLFPILNVYANSFYPSFSLGRLTRWSSVILSRLASNFWLDLWLLEELMPHLWGVSDLRMPVGGCLYIILWSPTFSTSTNYTRKVRIYII